MSETPPAATRPTPESAPPRAADGGEDQIQLDIRTEGPDQVVVTAAGEVDMLTSPRLRATVLEQLQGGAELVVLDLDGVTFLGTSGLAVLIELREAAHAVGTEFRLACTARRVLRPLTIAGLMPLFDIHETLAAALAET